jgi:hypothetical protein
VVEHRWRETLTNIVTPNGFLKARDEFLDRAFPRFIQGIEKVYGSAFDVKELTNYLRKDGRRFLEEGAIVYYELAALHQNEEAQALAFAELARRFGLDLFDAAGKVVEGEEANTRMLAFLRHRVALGVRHRDGSRLTDPEIQSIINLGGPSPFARGWEAYGKQVESELKTELVPSLLRMTGPYNFPFMIFASQCPRFAAALQLPGELVETNGSIDAPDRTSWKFRGDRSFPAGYAMKARSLEIDVELQKRALGKVLIGDRFRAESYVELVGSSDALREALRAARQTGSLEKLRDLKPKSTEEAARLARLRQMLALPL